MATEKQSTLTDRGSVLTTQLNSLANAAYCALGSVEHDNSANLDVWAIAELNVTLVERGSRSVTVTLGAVLGPSLLTVRR